MNELWIDYQLLELYPGTKIAFTFTTQDLTDPANVDGDGSNRFAVPNSSGNRAKLGYPDDVNSTSFQPYKKLHARYVQGGEELIVGHGIIEQAGDDIEIEVLSGNRDFFVEIEGKSMKDLPLAQYSHVWNRGNIINSFINSSGYIYPVINWHADNSVWQPPVEDRTSVHVEYLFPAMFVHTLLRIIAQEANYTFLGPAWSEAEMLNLLLLSDELSRDDSWKALREFATTSASDQGWIKVSAASGWVEAVTMQPAGDYNGFWYQAADSLYATFEASGVVGFLDGGFVSIDVDITNPDSGVTYATQSLTLLPAEAALVNGGIPVNKTYSLNSGQVQLAPGQHVYVRITYFGPTPYGSVISEYCVYAGAKFSVKIESEYSFGSTVDMSDAMPDMSQKDFVKGIMQMLGTVPVTNARQRTMYWGSLKEVHQNKVRAINMTRKIHRANKTTTFRFGNFGRFSRYKYKEDSSVPSGLGDGGFVVNDHALDADKTMVTLPFAATETEQRLNGLTVPIVKRLESGRQKKKTEPRVVMLDKQNISSSDPIAFTDGVGTSNEWMNIPLCYFFWTGKPYNLRWVDLLQRHHAELQLMLDRTKVLNAEVSLNEQDIATRDPLVPWYSDEEQAYFWVNNIEDFTEGDLTEVELFRL